MAELDVLETDLIKTLAASGLGRISYSRQRRPWSAGYRAKAVASAAAELKGFNSYGTEDTDHVILLRGQGRAAAATALVYDLPAGSPALPTDGTVVESEEYLNAVLLLYPPGERTNAIVIERIGTGVGDVTRQFWQVDDADTISIGYAYAAGPLYSDVPAGWIIEIQVPTTADIVTLTEPAAAATTVVPVTDFMAAGGTGATGTFVLDRIYR